MKYLPLHLPEAKKGNSVQVIIESTPHLPVPTSQIIRLRKQKRLSVIVSVIQYYLRKLFFFQPKLEMSFCNVACLA